MAVCFVLGTKPLRTACRVLRRLVVKRGFHRHGAGGERWSEQKLAVAYYSGTTAFQGRRLRRETATDILLPDRMQCEFRGQAPDWRFTRKTTALEGRRTLFFCIVGIKDALVFAKVSFVLARKCTSPSCSINVIAMSALAYGCPTTNRGSTTRRGRQWNDEDRSRRAPYFSWCCASPPGLPTRMKSILSVGWDGEPRRWRKDVGNDLPAAWLFMPRTGNGPTTVSAAW